MFHRLIDIIRPFRFECIILISSLLLIILFNYYTGVVLEDALITFRYAINIVQGNGFVFNLGEKVLGTTTPFFTLITAGLAFIGGAENIILLTKILSGGITLATGIVTGLILRKLMFPLSFVRLGMIAFLFHPITLQVTAGGMETPLVILLMALALLAITSGHTLRVGVWNGLLFLTRFDGLIWIICTFVYIICIHGWRSFF